MEYERPNFFGRVFAISYSGRYLMMERLDDITRDHYNESLDVPIWFQDNQPENFGINADGMKIRDYAMVQLPGAGAPPSYRVATIADTRLANWGAGNRAHWLKTKNSDAPAVRREAEDDWS
jgi:hypothetical protein